MQTNVQQFITLKKRQFVEKKVFLEYTVQVVVLGLKRDHKLFSIHR